MSITYSKRVDPQTLCICGCPASRHHIYVTSTDQSLEYRAECNAGLHNCFEFKPAAA